MKKKVIVIMAAATVTVGMVTAVYAKENIIPHNVAFRGSMMSQNNRNKNNNYNSMMDVMGENANSKTMDDFMNNMTDEQYNQMIGRMKDNGYGSMATMMEGIGREEMIKMHNSMGGSEGCYGSNGNTNGMMRR